MNEREHCGNDCGGTSANDGSGEWYEAEECVCCPCCCSCTPCTYAEDRAQREGTWTPGQWSA